MTLYYSLVRFLNEVLVYVNTSPQENIIQPGIHASTTTDIHALCIELSHLLAAQYTTVNQYRLRFFLKNIYKFSKQ